MVRYTPEFRHFDLQAGLILARLNEENKLAIKRQRNWEKTI